MMMATDQQDKATTGREAFFTRLYLSAFPPVAMYVSRRGGSFDEAKDVFHDAMIILYEKTAAGRLDTGVNETAYLVGIAKHLWLKKYNAGIQNTGLDGIDLIDAEEVIPAANRLMYFLEKAGHKCMQLLKSFYYDQSPLQEIAETFGFSGTRSATVQKYKCLEKVRETIKQKALQYEDFME